MACKERKRGGTSASRDENGQVDVWRQAKKTDSQVGSRERLGIDDTALVLQNKLRWYGHVL